MNALIALTNGRKTLALGVSLILYLVVCFINKQEPDPIIVDGHLAGMGLTIRHAVKKATPPKE